MWSPRVSGYKADGFGWNIALCPYTNEHTYNFIFISGLGYDIEIFVAPFILRNLHQNSIKIYKLQLQVDGIYNLLNIKH